VKNPRRGRASGLECVASLFPNSVIDVNGHRHQPGRLDSLKFFAGRGHRQILAGYYDGDPARIVEWLRDAAKVQGVIGVMYTTWKHDYRDLERFARILRPWREKQGPPAPG